MRKINFPFSAILGQDKMKMGLILNIIDPQIGGLLLTGHQGTGKSTAVRSLVKDMHQIEVIKDCEFSCNPHSDTEDLCENCRELKESGQIETEKKQLRLVNLPLGCTEFFSELLKIQ